MEVSRELYRTYLYDEHVALKAKISPFAGYEMPIYYDSVLKEHERVRTDCGMFDVSHMGQVIVSGKHAKKFLQYVSISDVEKLSPHKSQYSAILNEQGKMLDDIFIYMLEENLYMVCVNASNKEKDYEWFCRVAGSFSVEVKKQTGYSLLAVQGPNSRDKVALIVGEADRAKIHEMNFSDNYYFKFNDEKFLIARTGYTGEVGFELFCPNSIIKDIWNILFSAGVSPIGLGARDTLRLESCFLLYGNDMDETVSPLEAGISWVIKKDPSIDYIGKAAIDAERNNLQRKTYAFTVEGGIARHGMDVYKDGIEEKIGVITSGSYLPTLEQAGGMVRLSVVADVKVGDTLWVDIRGKRKKLTLVKKPLYVSKNK